MSQIIKKEIRLLLPAWIVAMLLAMAPSLISFIEWALDATVTYTGTFYSAFIFSVFISFGAGVLFLGISSFGQELNSGSLGLLLAQPMKRQRIWLVKIAALAVAFLSVWLTAFALISWQFRVFQRTPGANNGPDFASFATAIFEFLALSSIVSFSGGLWTTLLLRQTTAAFWFTLLTPLAIILGTLTILSDRVASGGTLEQIIVAGLAVYSVAGFLAAWRLFMRAQDLPWAGGEISLPGRQVLSKNKVIPSKGPNHWSSALAWKEVQLQQVNLLIAAIMLVLHLGCVVVRKIHPRFNNPDIQFVFETFWIFWLLMPVLIGCASMAEERRTGVMESQLCLPVSRRVQLFIKFAVGLALSILLGAAPPLLIEGGKVAGAWIFAVTTALFYISFYASSFSRTTLQAIGWATVLGLLSFYEPQVTFDPLFAARFYSSNSVGLGFFKLCLGLPVLLVTLAWLAYWNYRWVQPGKKVALRNVAVLVAAVVTSWVLANGIYFRAWELLKPIGPAIGSVRLIGSTEFRLSTSPSAICAVLPDDRLWAGTLAYEVISNRWQGRMVLIVPDRTQAQFISGSNWVGAAEDSFQLVGLKDNGTLWSIQRKWDPSRPRWEQNGAFTLTQIGTGADWKEVAARPMGFLLLKRDGSLWCWGTNDPAWRHSPNAMQRKFDSDLASRPTPVSDEANWSQLFSFGSEAMAEDASGRYWNWTEDLNGKRELGLFLSKDLKGEWLDIIVRPDGSFVGVTTSGELRFDQKSYVGRVQETSEFQLGKGMKWKAAEFDDWNQIAAIRDDGTLWKFSSPNGYWDISYDTPSEPIELGKDSSWVSLIQTHTGGPGFLAVAADGNLWAWDEPSRHFWLAPPRRPVRVGNIFESTTATTSGAQ